MSLMVEVAKTVLDNMKDDEVLLVGVPASSSGLLSVLLPINKEQLRKDIDTMQNGFINQLYLAYTRHTGDGRRILIRAMGTFDFCSTVRE